MSYITKNHTKRGGEEWEVGGELNVVSGGALDIKSGGALKFNGTDRTANLAALGAIKIAGGQETLTGMLEVDTGFTAITAAVATIEEDAALDPLLVTVDIGTSTFTIKLWKATTSGDVTPLESDATGKKVSWIAIGT